MKNKYFNCYFCKTKNKHYVPIEQGSEKCICCQTINNFNEYKYRNNYYYNNRHKNNYYQNGNNKKYNYKKKRYNKEDNNRRNNQSNMDDLHNSNRRYNIYNNDRFTINNLTDNMNLNPNRNTYINIFNLNHNSTRNANNQRNNNNIDNDNSNSNRLEIITLNKYAKPYIPNFDYSSFLKKKKIEKEDEKDESDEKSLYDFNAINKFSWLKKERMAKDLLDKEKEGYQCSICLRDIKLNQVIHETKCQHIFHYKCMEELVSHNSDNCCKCPNCRSILKEGLHQGENLSHFPLLRNNSFHYGDGFDIRNYIDDSEIYGGFDNSHDDDFDENLLDHDDYFDWDDQI